MNKSISISILSMIFLLSAGLVSGQEHADYKAKKKNLEYLNAKVINLKGDTLQALMRNFQSEVKWYGNGTGQIPFILKSSGKQKFSPKEIKGFQVWWKKDVLRTFISYDGFFLKERYKGKNVKLYDCQIILAGVEGRNKYHHYYLQKELDQKKVFVKKKDFKIGLYFDGCESLKSEIKAKKYKFRDILNVVKKYDSCL